MIPYFDLAVDSAGHKARRLFEGTLFVARKAPLGASATITVEVMDILWRYGPPGLASLVLRRQFIEVVPPSTGAWLRTACCCCCCCWWWW